MTVTHTTERGTYVLVDCGEGFWAIELTLTSGECGDVGSAAIDARSARQSVGTLYTDSGSYPEWEIRSCRVVPRQLGERRRAAYDVYIAPGWEWLGRGYGYGKRWFCKTCGAFTGPATGDRYHEGHDVEKD